MNDRPRQEPRELIGDLERHLFNEGRLWRLYELLGAHPMRIDGREGTRFVVWAPNASEVSVVGDFNDWAGGRDPLQVDGGSGLWAGFIPGVAPGALYKYQITGPRAEGQMLKADPVGFRAQHPPETASVVQGLVQRPWQDEAWMTERAQRNPLQAPMSIYEVHLGSWARVPEHNNRYLSYHELGERLIPYALEMGFTHLELMPVSEYPFDGSWGYQPIGLFAPSIRYGTADEFAEFIDRCHQAGLGVLLDWVPGHFPNDAHGLARFDGTALYEHADPRQGFHRDWNTLIYNFGRTEVRNFLIANALYWLDRFHIDGLRVDAVASMLYLDYSRSEGEWVPNRLGGRDNLEAIEFMHELNTVAHGEHPGAVVIAEESTAYPGVSRPVDHGGLGFTFKWNMGWMHDTLRYFARDPIHRHWHQDELTFALQYAFSENYVLPLSHDEVVHGKGSLIGKMPGDDWQRFANLRALFGMMWAHPGKKLLFMGGEFGQKREWSHDHSLDWHLLDDPAHRGLQRLVAELNRCLRERPALHRLDHSPDGFRWVDTRDSAASVLSWLRIADEPGSELLVILNLQPRVHERYRIGVPGAGPWRLLLNTDAAMFGGSDAPAPTQVQADEHPLHGMSHSIEVPLPPLATLLLGRR
ncbi:MAG: 1,4-alpha-glucan branching protein GlgB [Burkholderiaceae bacterium]